MAKTKIGLIRVVSFEDRKIAELHGRLIEQYYPMLQVISRCIKDQPKGIYNDETEALAIPKIVELGLEFDKEGEIKALIISCAADPGVAELRKQISIPVIGAGSAVAALALTYSDKVGTLGITEATPQVMEDILGSHLVAESKPEGVQTTLDLMTRQGKNKVLASVKSIKEKGAEVIALACTGYSTIGISEELERESGLPVLDAVLAAGLSTWYFTR
ncbi:hypothetical protein ES703_95074 [subsurface metagenome]